MDIRRGNAIRFNQRMSLLAVPGIFQHQRR
jgi:hypothetical protein